MFTLTGANGTAKIFTDNVEPAAISQIISLMNHPIAKDAHVRMMPDVHAGKGCTIGTTMKAGPIICPDLVGVDIGCGVLAAKLDVAPDDIDFAQLDSTIRRYIPSGKAHHQFNNWPEYTDGFVQSLICGGAVDSTLAGRSLGTLGGGNHFIELDVDSANNVWLLVHSGSRAVGVQTAVHYHNLAVEDNGESSIPVLTEMHSSEYLEDIQKVQAYAALNRETIISMICSRMGWTYLTSVESVHNYIDEKNIIRKGAIAAHKDQIILVPLNMRDGTLLCRGLGHPDWNESAPHGAGRAMSRSDAKENLSLEEYEKTMRNAGIFTTSVSRKTLDESPMAYKDALEIHNAIAPTAVMISHLKPIYNFKASN